MDYFNYRDGVLYAEDVPLSRIADEYGTPCYVYSKATFERHFRAYTEALGGHPHLICYAVKANSNLAVLGLLAKLGAGFDIVSIGELERVLKAGGDPVKVVFSGVAKQPHEMARALEVGIKCFNVESRPELERLNRVAGELGKVAPVSLRVNPDVDAGTHPYISTGLKDNKFGIPVDEALAVYQLAASLPNVQVKGLDCHIGSQLTETAPFLDALERLLVLMERLRERGIEIEHLDLGGGLGVPYRDEKPPQPFDYASQLLARLSRWEGGEAAYAAVRARPFDSRQCGCHAYAGRVSQAWRDQEFRHCRCGHERPDSSGAVPGLAGDCAGGYPPIPGECLLRRGGPRLRNR